MREEDEEAAPLVRGKLSPDGRKGSSAGSSLDGEDRPRILFEDKMWKDGVCLCLPPSLCLCQHPCLSWCCVGVCGFFSVCILGFAPAPGPQSTHLSAVSASFVSFPFTLCVFCIHVCLSLCVCLCLCLCLSLSLCMCRWKSSLNVCVCLCAGQCLYISVHVCDYLPHPPLFCRLACPSCGVSPLCVCD